MGLAMFPEHTPAACRGGLTRLYERHRPDPSMAGTRSSERPLRLDSVDYYSAPVHT